MAIVTGAAGGLGFGIAARLAEEQAVLLTDINAKLLGEAAAKLAANGATVAHVTCDVRDRASVQAAFAAPPKINSERLPPSPTSRELQHIVRYTI